MSFRQFLKRESHMANEKNIDVELDKIARLISQNFELFQQYFDEADRTLIEHIASPIGSYVSELIEKDATDYSSFFWEYDVNNVNIVCTEKDEKLKEIEQYIFVDAPDRENKRIALFPFFIKDFESYEALLIAFKALSDTRAKSGEEISALLIKALLKDRIVTFREFQDLELPMEYIWLGSDSKTERGAMYGDALLDSLLDDTFTKLKLNSYDDIAYADSGDNEKEQAFRSVYASFLEMDYLVDVVKDPNLMLICQRIKDNFSTALSGLLWEMRFAEVETTANGWKVNGFEYLDLVNCHNTEETQKYYRDLQDKGVINLDSDYLKHFDYKNVLDNLSSIDRRIDILKGLSDYVIFADENFKYSFADMARAMKLSDANPIKRCDNLKEVERELKNLSENVMELDFEDNSGYPELG